MASDPRGPIQKIVQVEPVIVLDCGHKPDLNPIYTYRVGDDCRCFACGKAQGNGE